LYGKIFEMSRTSCRSRILAPYHTLKVLVSSCFFVRNFFGDLICAREGIRLHKYQEVDKSGTNASIRKGKRKIDVTLNIAAVQQLSDRLGWDFPLPGLLFGYQPHFAKTFGKTRPIFGSHSHSPKEIKISPINIWFALGQERFEENIQWVLAHELKHHHQNYTGNIWYEFYGADSIAGMELQHFLALCMKYYLLMGFLFLMLGFFTSLPPLGAWWTPVVLATMLFYFFPYLAKYICECQADLFAQKQIRENYDLLEKCISVEYLEMSTKRVVLDYFLDPQSVIVFEIPSPTP